jgi:hypothetical protein
MTLKKKHEDFRQVDVYLPVDTTYLFNIGIKSLRATLPDEIFTGDFASCTVHFISICMKNQQMQQLFIQFINYVS